LIYVELYIFTQQPKDFLLKNSTVRKVITNRVLICIDFWKLRWISLEFFISFPFYKYCSWFFDFSNNICCL